MKVIATVFLCVVIFVSHSSVALAADDVTLKTPIDIDLKNTCLYESKAYSRGAKLLFTYNRPTSGLVVQEAQECHEANMERKDSGAYWKTFSVSCKNPITNKGEGC